jgi:hypothetical protein
VSLLSTSKYSLSTLTTYLRNVSAGAAAVAISRRIPLKNDSFYGAPGLLLIEDAEGQDLTENPYHQDQEGDARVKAAVAAGLTKHRTHLFTGIGRSTGDRILAPLRPVGHQ